MVQTMRMRAACQLRRRVSMTNVQIAIRDRSYAEELGCSLEADGSHRVYFVDLPTRSIDGIAVVDETVVDQLISADGPDLRRCVIFTTNPHLDVDKLWKCGVRHVIQADYPPNTGRFVVLAAETCHIA
jgi:hypothetical protein